MPEFSQQTAVGLLRALQRQFADLGNLAAGKALELPDTSFTHYRKLGEATGLHTAWRMVADLADQLEGVELVTPIDTSFGPDRRVISVHTSTEPNGVDSIDAPEKRKGGPSIHTPCGPRGLSAAGSLRNLQADLRKLSERALARRSKGPETEQPGHQAAADAYHTAWRRVAELAQRFEDRERAGQ